MLNNVGIRPTRHGTNTRLTSPRDWCQDLPIVTEFSCVLRQEISIGKEVPITSRSLRRIQLVLVKVTGYTKNTQRIAFFQLY